MGKGNIDNRFSKTTRGQIVGLLRGTPRTVEDMAASLHLTGNAVRAQLSTLERDGLVTQTGLQRGARKPHFTYVLTPAGEELFPKSYDVIFDVLLTVLKEKLSSSQLKKILRRAGRTLARYKMESPVKGSGPSVRIQQAMDVLEALGGSPRLETEGGKTIIRSASCPLGKAVDSHPEACAVAEALVREITQEDVRERCNKTDTPPHCLFEIEPEPRRHKV